jgi:hypothetical protein
MEVLAVFRGGRWIRYMPRVNVTADPRITAPLRQKAASAYVTALQKGFQEERAHVLAEAVILRDIYEELTYEPTIEKDLQALMDRGGKA